TCTSPAELPASHRETNMTTLQDNAGGPAFQNEPISPARLLLLAPSELRAPIAILSPAKRNALIACFNTGGLHKKDGAWHGPPDGKPESGLTTADLARDGMLTKTRNNRFGSAQLTERGNWLARTLVCLVTTENLESVRFGRCSPARKRLSNEAVLLQCMSSALAPSRLPERQSNFRFRCHRVRVSSPRGRPST